MSNTLLGLLAATILLWVGLAVWRQTGSELMQRIERSYLEHYRSHPGEHGELGKSPPLVRWDFEQDTLVAIPPEEVQISEGTDGLTFAAVKETDQRDPLFAHGIILARIPGVWFHGAFAAASLLLAFFAISTRAQ